jgi:hypothetical protein
MGRDRRKILFDRKYIPDRDAFFCALLCLPKHKEGGVENALTNAPGRGHNSEISNEEKHGLLMQPVANE